MAHPRPRSRSLFLRIFLYFWLAMTLIGAAFAVIYVSSTSFWVPTRKLTFISQALRHHGVAALERLRTQGPEAAHRFNRQVEKRLDVRLTLIHHGAAPPGLRAPTAEIRKLAEQALRTHQPAHRVLATRECYAVPLSGPSRQGWAIVGELPHRSRLIRYLQPETLPLRILVVVLVAGLICYLLARHISRPIRALQRTTRRLARGHLDARVGADIRRRRDETGELGRDFDRMADRIQTLLDAQERLLRDISHELRSPLARLNVALGLAHQKATPESAAPLHRIEKETERLNELISHLTTLTRLESGVNPLEREALDLTALVEEIGQDVSFEGAPRDRHVVVSTPGPLTIHGSRELLRRAIENVIRNGLHHTADSTPVEVTVESAQAPGGPRVRLSVRDHGPGVPEDALQDIFRPFFRVADDRGRESGGVGLGLAIARRAVLLHGGSLRAENTTDGGLRVVLELPVDSPRDTDPA